MSIVLICYFCAFVCFLLATLKLPVVIDLTNAGFMFLTLSLIVR